MKRREFEAGLAELERAGGYGADARRFAAVAAHADLRTDLSLIEILSHWLAMLKHREKVLADRHATGFEVHGYREACSACKTRWGIRPFEPRWAPPFHPGCRCFSQPRFTN